jgi:hypothetical protein
MRHYCTTIAVQAAQAILPHNYHCCTTVAVQAVQATVLRYTLKRFLS